jgi:hypothetical protein
VTSTAPISEFTASSFQVKRTILRILNGRISAQLHDHMVTLSVPKTEVTDEEERREEGLASSA